MGGRTGKSKTGGGGAAAATDPAPALAPMTGANAKERIQDVLPQVLNDPANRFGENKVFIGPVYDAAKRNDPSLTREQFNKSLVDANRDGRLTLARADLISAMNPQMVRSSEISLSNSTFHFIRLDRNGLR